VVAINMCKLALRLISSLLRVIGPGANQKENEARRC
jgi:hypothetical protein